MAPRHAKGIAQLVPKTERPQTTTEPKHPFPSSTSNTPGQELSRPEDQKQSRKHRESQTQDETPRKRPRMSRTIDANTAASVSGKGINLLEYWIREGSWSKKFFEPESNLLARKKPFRSKQSEAGSTAPVSAPSDEIPREAKSIPYARPSYETVLAAKKSFMDTCDQGIQKASRDLCETLLSSKQAYPRDSLFRDDLFDTTCRKIRNQNEAMIIRDISPLIVPSAQTLAIHGATHLNHLMESVNEGWNSARPFYGPRPQPDYSLGFGRFAFTDDQLKKLEPFVGEDPDSVTSLFMATWQMYFPFLSCEVKCGNQALDIADRQNAHSMTLAVRGIVELFRMAKREKELHLQILAFSVSHNQREVRIYGHYPLMDGEKTEFYRHPILDMVFALGKEKWAAYTFIRNVYDIWMLTHLERISSAIDALSPNLEQSELGRSGLSQRLAAAESSYDDSLDVTLDTWLSQRALKRLRKGDRNMESHR
ncbi:hypothetical protein ACQKWADRAFT_291755 [Trichoderma austrokoningii]